MEDEESPPPSNAKTPESFEPTTAENYEKEEKREELLSIFKTLTQWSMKMQPWEIEHGSEIVFKNDKYTTYVTFEFVPERKTNQLNVFESHKKVFTAIETMDTTIKIITNIGKVFGHSDSSPEE